MMYYDRTVSEGLLKLLEPNEPLSWLVDYVKSTPHMRLDFRRASGLRKHGALQFYLGRTSPLEMVSPSNDDTINTIKLTANDKYRKKSQTLFMASANQKTRKNKQLRVEEYKVTDLLSIEKKIQKHFDAIAKSALKSFTEGEAESHMGMMRRYGLFHQSADPFFVVDSEIKVGFKADKVHESGTEHKNDYNDDLHRDIPSLPKKRNKAGKYTATYSKLDAIGVLKSGDVALIEVKDEVKAKKGGDIIVAVKQAAVHMHRFTAFQSEQSTALHDNLEKMIDQKIGAKLLPSHVAKALKKDGKLVPIVAAPDKNPNWATKWRADIDDLLKKAPDFKAHLKGLRLWRLSPEGFLMEEEIY